MITICELAEMCGVSSATVSFVVNKKDKGRVGAATRAKVLRVLRQHGYRSNTIARGLVERRTYRIGIVLRGALSDHAIIGEFSLYDRLGLLARRLHAKSYSIELIQINRHMAPAWVIRELESKQVDGFVFLDWPPQQLAVILDAMAKAGRPAVASGTTLDATTHTWVNVDRHAAIQDAVRRLAGLGHREIALIETNVRQHYIRLKVLAFVEAVSRELGVNGTRWVHAPDEKTYWGVVGLTERIRTERKDVRSFLLTDNFYGEAALFALRRTGLTPGRDCRVIGFGDTAIADRCSPKLSHYSLQAGRQVDFAIEALQRWTQAPAEFTPTHELLPPEFVERET